LGLLAFLLLIAGPFDEQNYTPIHIPDQAQSAKRPRTSVPDLDELPEVTIVAVDTALPLILAPFSLT
jgi:hypothetical protein